MVKSRGMLFFYFFFEFNVGFSLVASIQQIRPDLLPDFDKNGTPPISSEIPKNFFVVNEIPDVGELTLASLPENYLFDPKNWYCYPSI